VLVPYPEAADDHQIANAKVFASAGASRLIDETSQSGALEKARSIERANAALTLYGRNIGRVGQALPSK